MYLKSIEINGFKSFANKIKFEFPHGLTGIVGPNGSGKSNIGDAVRWVLGEQSAKQLRGSKMEDVIFAGTQNRKPMGFAYVSMVFDNKDRKIALDYDEVKVARRVYRSGESEYLLNGSSCRRRDIVEIFYDTGIGKEGYSIIGQGQVEKILSGKIEDSRELFDEAAGIAKYKKNRSIAEKNLEQERDNLSRVTDILSELEKQVGPLERQSKKAKVYLNLRDREKELDIGLFLHDFDVNQDKKKEAEGKYQIIRDEMSRVTADYEEKKKKNLAISKEAEDLDSQIQEMEGQREEYAKREEEQGAVITEQEHTIDKNRLSMEHYCDLKSRSAKEKEEKEEQYQSVLEKIEEQTLLLADYRDACKILKVDAEKKQQEKIKIEGKIAARQDTFYDYLNANTDAKEKLSRYEAMEEQLGIRNAEYSRRLLGLNNELNDYKNRSVILERELEEAHQNWETADQEYNQVSQSCEEMERRLSSLQKEVDAGRQDYLRKRSRYDTLVSINEKYEGYHKSIQHIMEQKKKNPGIIGVVADIIHIEKQYETAIEIALGGALQNIVTENDQVAKDLIRFLKNNRFGRATFLPLTSIQKRNSRINPLVLNEEGVIGTASSLVKREKRFDDLVESLLGKTVVVDQIDHAMFLAKKYNYSLRLVTLGGELLNPGGSITGGAYRSSSNLLGRNREIEEMQTALEQAKVFLTSKTEAVKNLTEGLEKEKDKAARQKETLDQLVITLHDYHTQLPDLKEKEKDLSAKIYSLKKDHASLKEQLAQIKKEKEVLAKDQKHSEKAHEENHEAIALLEEELSVIAKAAADLDNQLNEKILQISQCEQQIQFYQNEKERLKKECAALNEAIGSGQEQIHNLEKENQILEEKLIAHKEKRSAWLKKIEEAYAALEEYRKMRRDLTIRQNKSYQESEQLNEQLRLLEKEESRLSSQMERYSENLESLINYMWDNYEITYNYAKNLKRDPWKESMISEYRKEKKEIGSQIKKLGSVNVNAIEEYKEVGERYSFMKQQYEDIKESEEKLVHLIEDLNKAMEKQFRNSFQDIQDTFTKVFADLFEGGTASLELMDSSNILECGIRIVAQPPGKKLQNILLLSGGEKALTAIALLFAIQNLKPSPFCLLDEIEAALDDANIVRFAKYLRKLSKDTQFIIITHRRGTMSSADVLYGITMQEKGISTLISVDLIDKQLA